MASPVIAPQDFTTTLEGATALIEAIYNNDMKVINILLAAKADTEARNSVGVRPPGG